MRPPGEKIVELPTKSVCICRSLSRESVEVEVCCFEILNLDEHRTFSHFLENDGWHQTRAANAKYQNFTVFLQGVTVFCF